MNGSSVEERKNIRSNFIERIEEKEINNEDLVDIDIYLYFTSLNKLDKKVLKETKKQVKRNIILLKYLVLKDILKEKKSLNHLETTSNYCINLLKESLNNYKTLQEYSNKCCKDYDVINEKKYLEYVRYCNDYYNLGNRLLEDIKDRPSNSALLVNYMEISDKELHLRANNNDLVKEINKITNNNKILYK